MFQIFLVNVAHGEPVIQTSTVRQINLGGGNLLGDLAMVLFEYQKLAGKEAREDSKPNTSEASNEYLIGLFQKLNSADHNDELQLLRKCLEELKQQTQKISDEVRLLRERGDSPTHRKRKKKTR
jgi:hypothetical protein